MDRLYIEPDRYVTVELYSLISGRTEKAIRKKIEVGKWIEKIHYYRDPDGGITIDREAVAKWVTGSESK